MTMFARAERIRNALFLLEWFGAKPLDRAHTRSVPREASYEVCLGAKKGPVLASSA